MKTILIINPKGGAGKTTLATNLAAALATVGNQDVWLWDLDRQHSALAWLALRPDDRPQIKMLANSRHDRGSGDKAEGWLVLDAPAGIHGKMLQRTIKLANKVIVPIQPSVFDMAASAEFMNELLQAKRAEKQKAQVGIVGMRVDARTRAAATLGAFVQQFDLPVISWIRDTQIYTNAAFNGLGVFDLPDSLSGRDKELWRPILDWIEH